MQKTTTLFYINEPNTYLRNSYFICITCFRCSRWSSWRFPS